MHMARKPDIQRTHLTRETLARLAAMPTDGHVVVSLYLDLDPARFTHLRDRYAELDSVLEVAERKALGESELPRAERLALRDDLDQVRELIANKEELAPPSARGLAIFRSGPAGIFELVRLPRAVEPMAVISSAPLIEPLAELAAPERWCALLVSRRSSRILVGTRERLAEADGVLDDVHGQHSQGGWSQARYQRGIEREVEDHIRTTGELLFKRFQRRPFDRLLVGGPPEMHGRVEGTLHTDLRKRLAGHFEIDVERASVDEVHQRALPLVEAAEQRREAEALAQLREGVAPNGHAAAGADQVLELLSERRVQTLLVAEGADMPGFTCPKCGWLVTESDSGTCDADGTTLERRQDVIESAITAALAQDADVLVVHHERDKLDQFGPLAALLRY
jgi:peptide subunit release factor 1 (eRF1)